MTTKAFNFSEKPENQSCGYIGLRGVDVVTSHIYNQNQAINRELECEKEGIDKSECEHKKHKAKDHRRLTRKTVEKRQLKKGGKKNGKQGNVRKQHEGDYQSTTYNTTYSNYYYADDMNDEYYYEPYSYDSTATYDTSYQSRTGPNGEPVYQDAEGKEYYYDSNTMEMVYLDQTLYYTTTGNAKFVHVCGRSESKGECNDRCDCLGGKFHDDTNHALIGLALAILLFFIAVILAAYCYVKWNNKWVRYEELREERLALRMNAGMGPNGRAAPSQTSPAVPVAAAARAPAAATRARSEPQRAAPQTQNYVVVGGAPVSNNGKQGGNTVMGQPVMNQPRAAPQPLAQQQQQPGSAFQQVPSDQRLPPTYYVVQ